VRATRRLASAELGRDDVPVIRGTIALLAWTLTVAATDQPQSPVRVDSVLQNLIENDAQHHHGKVSMYAKALRTGQTVAIDADVPVNTASVIKLAIMLEAMYQVKERRVT